MKNLRWKKACMGLVCIMLLSLLSGCMKSEEAKLVDDTILAIGEVSLDSEDAIIKAEILLNNLDEKTRKQIENETVLIDARNTYIALRVSEVENVIAKLNTVTVDSGQDILSARAKYQECDQSIKDKVSNYVVLEEAEANFPKIVEVSGLIQDIGDEVTYNSKSVIETARKAYDGCTDKVKAGIANYDMLLKAETTFADIIELQELIKQLETVTYNSGDLIKSIRIAYSESTPEVKNGINNLFILQSAESNYNLIVNLQESIDNLQYITVDIKNTSIATVRKNYTVSSTTVKNGITNLSILEAKENELAALKIEAVEELISQIGTITLEKKELVEAAKKAYDELRLADKKYVGNSETLTNAISTLNRLEKEKEEKAYKDALSRLTTSSDSFQGVTWYKSKTQPKYANDRCFILPYFGSSHTIDHYWLRIQYHYTGSRWLFYEEMDGTYPGVDAVSGAVRSCAWRGGENRSNRIFL